MKITSSSGKEYLVQWESYGSSHHSPHIYMESTRVAFFGLFSYRTLQLLWQGDGMGHDWFAVKSSEAMDMPPAETLAHFTKAVDTYERNTATGKLATPEAWSL